MGKYYIQSREVKPRPKATGRQQIQFYFCDRRPVKATLDNPVASRISGYLVGTTVARGLLFTEMVPWANGRRIVRRRAPRQDAATRSVRCS